MDGNEVWYNNDVVIVMMGAAESDRAMVENIDIMVKKGVVENVLVADNGQEVAAI